jgi:hypothetical protein
MQGSVEHHIDEQARDGNVEELISLFVLFVFQTYCPSPSINSLDCPESFYCVAGSASPVACPAGYYCASKTAIPVACAAGTFCAGSSATPKPCPAGSFCPATSATPTPCTTVGTYCPANSTQALQCPPDSACEPDANGQFASAVPIECSGNFWRESYASSSDCSKLTPAAIAIIVCLSVFVFLVCCLGAYLLCFGAAARKRRQQKKKTVDTIDDGTKGVVPEASLNTAVAHVAADSDGEKLTEDYPHSSPVSPIVPTSPVNADDISPAMRQHTADGEAAGYKRRIQPLHPSPRPAGSPSTDAPPLQWDTDQTVVARSL